MSMRMAVDFDGNDWAALYALPTDAANIFGAAAVDVADMPRFTNGAGGATSTGDFFQYYDDRAKYGKSYITWTTGTVVTANVNIGYDAVTTWTLGANVVPTGNYVAVLWAKRQSGNDNTFRMIVQRDSATTVATGSSQTISSSGWTKFTLSFSFTASAGDDKLYLMLQRTNGDGTTQQVLVTGPMIVAGTSAPTWFNCGEDSLLEPITDYVLSGDWKLGFVKPYQYVAPLGTASFTLTNTDKRFSPEYGSSPINSPDGYMRKLLQVGDPDYGIWWTGWVDSINAKPGTKREQTALLKASDARRFMDGTKVFVPLSVGASSETDPLECITDVMALVESPIDATMTGLESGGDFAGFDAGSTAWPAYYFDSNDENADVAKIVADIIGAQQGHFLFNRTGQWMPFESVADDDTTASYDIGASWIDAEYVYGERVINRCEVTVHPKKIAGSTSNIWELDEQITLAAGESDSFRVNFRNNGGATGDKTIVGATNTAVGTWTLSAGTVPTHVTVTLSEITAQSCLVTVANISGATRTITAGTITGNKVIALRTVVQNYEISASVLDYGVECLQLNFEWVSSRKWAKKLAKWVVTRFYLPRGEFRWVTLDGNEQTALLFNCGITTSVSVEDDQTDHSDIYGVIGEAHTVREGMKDHVGKLYLEPMYGTTIEDTTLP